MRIRYGRCQYRRPSAHTIPIKNTTPTASPNAERLVRMTVQELQRVGHLVIDLERDGDHEQADETEIDARVHDSRGRVAQQRVHQHAASIVTQPSSHVVASRATVVRSATLIVTHALRREPSDEQQHRRRHGVERDLHRGGNVDEDLTTDRRSIVPVGQRRCDATRKREYSDDHADAEHELVGPYAMHVKPSRPSDTTGRAAPIFVRHAIVQRAPPLC